jgi:hypothetical protein
VPLDLKALRADMADRIARGVDGADLSARTVREILDRAIAAEESARDALTVIGALGYSPRSCSGCKRKTYVRGFICFGCGKDNSATPEEE